MRPRTLLAAALIPGLLGLPARLPAAVTDGSTLPLSRGATGLADPSPGAVEPASSSLFTGAATTRIPLEVPPGIQGMEPQLALQYSSHAAASPSWVGAGWSLGVSRIQRSLEEGVPAYDDAKDRFVLDGRELVKGAPGGSGGWHTRRQSFLRIERVGSYGWTVRDKDGTVSRYGFTASAGAKDDCAIRKPATGEYFAFLLCEREDVHGNRLTVVYDRSDPGVAYPRWIQYDARSVEFELEPGTRPDVSLRYRAGFRQERTRRLAAVDVRAAGERIRRYELDYGAGLGDGRRSLLRALRLHGADYGTAGATPPRVWTFTYRDGGPSGWAYDGDWTIPGQCLFVTADQQDGGTRLADLNGDALPDLVRQEKVDQSVENTADSGLWLNTGAGFAAAPEWSFPMSPAFELPTASKQPRPESWRNAFVTAENGARHSMGTILADLDADGRADLLVSKTTLSDYAQLNTGQILNARQEYLRNTGSGWARQFVRSLGNDDGYSIVPPGVSNTGQWAWTEEIGGTDPAGGPGWPTGSPVSGDAFPAFSLAFSTYVAAYLDDLDAPAEWSRTVDGATALADLQGDGRPELVTRTNVVGASLILPPHLIGYEHSFTEIRSDGTGFAPLVSDRFEVCTGTTPECNERRVGTFYKLAVRNGPQPAIELVADGSERFGKRFVDVNGDGLDDQATAVDVSPAVGKEVLLSDGRDFVGTGPGAAWTLPGDLYFDAIDELGISRDQGVRFVDLNGDGRGDLLQSGLLEGGGARSRAWLNTGDPDLGWEAQQSVPVPPGMELTDAEGRDRGVRLSDLDGDGRLDLIRCAGEAGSGGPVQQVWRQRGRLPDLLRSVETPLGGVTRLHYETSPEAGQYLPRVFPVVSRIETKARPAAGAAPDLLSVRTFDYEGGSFDAEEREFRGFREVAVAEIDPEAPAPGVIRETRHLFHQDDARAGLLERREVRDAEGVLWAATERSYTPDADGLPPYTSLVATETRFEYDGATTPRRSRTRFEYDDGGPIVHGNRTREERLGEIDAAGSDVNPGDSRLTTTEYVVNEARNLHRVKRRRVEALDGSELLRETRYFYDGDTSGDAPPTEGKLTRKEREGGPLSPDAVTTYGYDAFGNVERITDPRHNAREVPNGEILSERIEYDSTFHTFPVARENELGHRTELGYAPPADCAVDYPDGAGKVATEQGPNALAAGASWRRCYDAFGRLVRERAPADLAEAQWRYEDVRGDVRVTRRRRVVQGGGFRERTTHLDGLGRVERIRADGPQVRDVIETVRRYDAAGRLQSETAPHFAGSPPPPTTFGHDVLGRVVCEGRPGSGPEACEGTPGGGRVWVTRRDRGVVTRTDPNGRQIRHTYDPMGNLVRVEELDGGLTYTTRYEYDAADELVKVVDDGDNEVRIVWDDLGRKRRIWDPDAGFRELHYTRNGDPSFVETPIGDRGWLYDHLDRPTSGGGNTWTYDDATNGIGRMRKREFDLGNHQVTAYDLLGRPTNERYFTQNQPNIVSGPHHDFETTYDAFGQRETRSYPNGTTLEWQRDGRGYLEGIRVAGGEPFASGVEWDARGRLQAWTAGNGVETVRSFEPETRRLDTLHIRGPGGATLEDLDYGYNPSDQVLSLRDHRDGSLDRIYLYDRLGRLKTATGPFGPGGAQEQVRYHYSPTGNLECRAATGAVGSVGDCTVDGGTRIVYPEPGAQTERPHAPVSVDGAPATYDDAGNLTGLGDRTFERDELGRLRAVLDAGTEQARFQHDGPDRIVRIQSGNGKRHRIAPDFEWNQTHDSGRIHVHLAGRRIATQKVDYDAGTGGTTGGRCGATLPALSGGGSGAPPPWAVLGLLAPGLLAWAALRLGPRLPRAVRRVRAGPSGPPVPRRRRLAAAGTALVFLVAGLLPHPLGSVWVAPAHAASPTATTYYHADHLGSSVLVTDASGAVASRTTYLPYGAVAGGASTGSPQPPELGFTGQRHVAPTGLYDYGARFYDPAMGRFLSPDALVPDPADPESLNRYAYTRNDPVNRIDPTGSFDVASFVGEAAGGFNDYVLQPAVDLGVGAYEGAGYSLGLLDKPAAGGFLYDQGVGLGSLAAGGVGLGLEVAAAPLSIGANFLGLGPRDAANGRPAAGRALSNVAQGIFSRADDLSQSHPSLGGILARDDVAGLGTGLVANALGLSQGIGNIAEGAFTLNPAAAGAGAIQLANALVPRFGRFAGPGYGRFDLTSLSTPIGVFSRRHDLDYERAERSPRFTRAMADRRLVDSLRTSFSTQKALGLSAQIYRLGEYLAFEGRARAGGE